MAKHVNRHGHHIRAERRFFLGINNYVELRAVTKPARVPRSCADTSPYSVGEDRQRRRREAVHPSLCTPGRSRRFWGARRSVGLHAVA